MNWQAIFTALSAEQAATWQEYELGSERKVSFLVRKSRWFKGKAVVEVSMESPPEHLQGHRGVRAG